VNVSEAGLAVNVGTHAVSKQHTSATMSGTWLNKAFLVVFKNSPVRQDVRVSQKYMVTMKQIAIVRPLDS